MIRWLLVGSVCVGLLLVAPRPAFNHSATRPESPAGEVSSDTATGGSSGVDDFGRVAEASATWYRHVLPIVQRNCQGCHNSAGIGSFPLSTYQDAVRRRNKIVKTVKSGAMPPWKPAESCRPLKDSRRLAQSDIETIAAWVSGGALAGDPDDAPAPRQDPEPGLPWVDASLDPGSDYTPAPAPGDKDDYRCLIIKHGLTEDRDVIGVDIEPGARKIVHHAVLFQTDAAEAAALDSPGGGGWYCFGSSGLPTARTIGIWTPGTGPTRYPPGTGITLKANSVLVMQVHYNLENDSPMPDRTSVKLQYAKERVPRPARFEAPQVPPSMVIPPRTTGWTITSPPHELRNATVWGVLPHMHTRGRRIRVEADGKCLLEIPDWDFHWQGLYFFAEPVRLGANGVSRVTCSWDNATEQPLVWGETTDKEMCVGALYTTD